MTSPAAQAQPQPWMNRNTVAAAAAIVAAVLTAIGQLKGGATGSNWIAWLIELAAIAVATGLVFWLVVPRSLARGDTGLTAMSALILAVAGFLSLIVFWLGLPTVLAAGAAYLALRVEAARATRTQRALSLGALVLAGATVLLAILVAIVG